MIVLAMRESLERVGVKIARNGVGVFDAVASPSLSILMFHRVHARADPLFPSEPDAERFERLMRFVGGAFRVMSLGEALSRLSGGQLPRRALVVTFDDGYADNVEVALPILQRYGLKATFFIASGFIDGGRMWNDSVIGCLRSCRHQQLDLGRFGLGAVSLAGPGERRAAIDALLPRIKYLPLGERDAAIHALQDLCGVRALPRDLMMRSEQVRALHQAGMEIGGHTVNHPILTALEPSEAETEIAGGRAQLQSIVDAPIDVFAYPNGRPDIDYEHSHVALVRRLGFRGAVSTAKGVARSADSLFELPRFTPWGDSLSMWTSRLLANRLTKGFDVAKSVT